VIVRGEKVFEYTIPSFIPEWLLPEIEPPSVFDDPMGDFEPTFGSPPPSKDRPSLSADLARANASAPHQGGSVYDWSSTSSTPSSPSAAPSPLTTKVRRESPKINVTASPAPTLETAVGGLGVGGATVLVLYTLAYAAINVLGLLEDLSTR